jgi:hypothetical protein
LRTLLAARRTFQGVMADAGRTWWEYMQHTASAYATPLSISFANVATHNHFVLDRGGHIFDAHAPVIKLSKGSPEEDHIDLLGLLNSSTACFWLKMVSHAKGGTDNSSGGGNRWTPEAWIDRYEFTGASLQNFPVPRAVSLKLSHLLNDVAQHLETLTPAAVCNNGTPKETHFEEARKQWANGRGRMVSLQEELDWEVYRLYGLLTESEAAELTIDPAMVPNVMLGERAFEIVLARKMAMDKLETQWFSRHGSTPNVEVPSHWPDGYRRVVEKRIAFIEKRQQSIGLIERPEYKRRWALTREGKPWGWNEQAAAALRGWLLDRFEARELWFESVDGVEQPRLLTAAQLADALRADEDLVSVSELYASGKDLEDVVAELVADEHVPYLAALRYKDSGMSKRADWEHVWDLQRDEDAAQVPADAARLAVERQREIYEKAEDDVAKQQALGRLRELEAKQREAEAHVMAIRNSIPVPPKYGSGDFRKSSFWRHRGKLDVPKERFISYPGASPDNDQSLLLGWAGWDHREQAQALATLIVDREQNEGWGADRLTPLLAGLREVLPWVKQWHNEIDPVYAASPAEIYTGFLDQTCARLHLKDEDLTAWRPPPTGRGRKKSEG